MTENLQPRELPHQLLMRRYSIGVNDLKPHARQLKKDLDKTLQLVINKSKGGAIRLTPATQSKIEAYDRYVCDGIFEILEDKEVMSENLVEEIKESAEEKREEIVEKMEQLHEEAKEDAEENQWSGIDRELQAKDNENNPQQVNKTEDIIEDKETQTEPSEEKQGIKVGFWNWK